ncbi:MAG: glycosyltransferase family 2 protein [Dermatophilaceae bacterium]
MSGRSVVAVIVTHQPEIGATRDLLLALTPQVDDVVLIDNGSPPESVSALREATGKLGVTFQDLGSNRGIAAAQNVGIAWARQRNAAFVLLSDQDSIPASDMVSRLLAGFARASATGADVAAVGPITVDERNKGAVLLFSDHRWGPRRACVPSEDGSLVPATFLIASGCLISAEALDTVGVMNEPWFIDHIDLEWGLRARRTGYTLYGVAGARLKHELGDRTQRIPGRSRDVHIHSPVRNYYMARNTVLLVRSGLMVARWRWGYAAWITKYAVFYLLSVPPRATRARLITQGFIDGVKGRTGPLKD